MKNRVLSALACAASSLLVLLLAGEASALSLTLTSSEGGDRVYSAAELGCSAPGAGGTFSCTSSGLDLENGPYATPFWQLNSWNFTANADPFVNGNISLTNPQGVTQQITALFNLVTGPIGPSTVIGGSVSGSYTSDGTAGSVSAPTGSSIYTALIDGISVATLHADPFSVGAGPFLSASVPPASFGTPIPSAAGPAVTANIGLQLDFNLTAGDQASFTSVFVVEAVPEPSLVLMLLGGVAALLARRRS